MPKKKKIDPRETTAHKNDFRENRRFARGEKPGKTPVQPPYQQTEPEQNEE